MNLNKIIRKLLLFLRIDIFETLIKSDSYNLMNSADVLLLSGDVDRSLYAQGKRFSPIIDSIIDDFELNDISYNSAASPWALFVGRRCFNYTYSFNRLYFLCYVVAKVADYFRLPNAALMLRQLPFQRILEASGCKVVMGIDLSDVLCAICTDNNIKTIEVMHTMGYCKVTRGWEERKQRKLPDAIFCYDFDTQKTYSNFSKKIEIKTINHPFLSKFSSSSKSKEKYQELFGLTKCVREYHKNEGKFSILYCCQWGYDSEIRDLEGILKNGVYPDFFPDIIRQTQGSIDWHFRAHPVQLLGGRYQGHLNAISHLALNFENAFWNHASVDPLPEVLDHVDGMLTMTSQSIYDAAYFNVKSAIMCPTTQPGGRFEYLGNSLIEEGFLTRLLFEQESLLNWLQRHCWVENSSKYSKRKYEDISNALKSQLM